jgi:surface carbohydrate biosynthesis protein
VREFHSRLTLAAEAVSRGWTVVIGRKIRPKHSEFYSFPPSVVVAKSANAGELDSILAFRERGHIYGVMDEEGLVIGDLEYHGRYRYPANVREAVDFSLLWGDLERTALGVGPDDPKHSVTGNPRLDLWRNEAFGLYDADVRRIRAKYGDFVLVPSTFGSALVSEDELRRRVEGSYPSSQFDAVFQRYKEVAAHLGYSLEGYRETLGRLGEAGIPVVFRPHPRDDIAELRRRVGNVPNVWIVGEGPATPWILASRGFVHLNCTTALEAILLGRHVIQHRPGHTPDEWMNFGVRQAGEPINDAAHLVSRLKDILSGSSLTLQGDQTDDVRRYASLDGGRSASARIMDKIEGLAKPASVAFERRSPLYAAKQNLKALLSKANGDKFPPTSAFEVERSLKAILAGRKTQLPFRCVTVADNLFEISPA